MNKNNLILLFLVLLFSCCESQEKRIDISPDCLEYVYRAIVNNDDYSNTKCTKALEKGSDFIMKRNESEYVTFSISNSLRVDKELVHVKDSDTLLYEIYANGTLIESIRYKNKKIDTREYLKDSLYFVEYPDFEEDWILNDQLAFRSKKITLIKNLNKELLKVTYIDSLGTPRFVTNYKQHASFLYNSKGILIEKTKNSLNYPSYQDVASNGDSILIKLSPRAFNCKPFVTSNNTTERELLIYNDLGKLTQKFQYNINSQYGINKETHYFFSGKIRKKEVYYLTGGIKTRTYDSNNKLIKETIKIIEEPEVIMEPDEKVPEMIIKEKKQLIIVSFY